ncbi:MAG: Ig-like domain-containing protein [Solirubrobacterales bacterium]
MYSAISRVGLTRKTLVAIALLASAVSLTLFVSTSQAWQYDPCLTLNPPAADNPLNTSHTVTATVTSRFLGIDLGDSEAPSDDFWKYGECGSPEVNANPLPNVTVSFLITSGPNAGTTGSAVTNAQGQATFTWVGAIAGTDTVQASVTDSKEITHWECNEPNPTAQTQNGSDYCDDKANWVEIVDSTKYLTYTATAIKNWIPPTTPPNDPPVTVAGAPAVKIALAKRCQTRKFKIRASHANGTPTGYVLKVDGKTVKKSKGGSTNKIFTVDSGKYKAGTHTISLTTTFSNGTKVVKTGKFKRCKVRTAARRVNPNFTG